MMNNDDDDADAGISLLSGPIFVTVSTSCLDRLDFAFCAASEQWDAEFSPSYSRFFGYHTC